MKNGVVLVLDYTVHNAERYKKSFIHFDRNNTFIELVNSGLINEVLVYNTETERVETYNNDKIASLLAAGKIGNILTARNSSSRCFFRLGDKRMDITEAWGPRAVYYRYVDDLKDQLICVVGTSIDEKYLVAITVRGEHRFISFEDIKNVNIGKNGIALLEHVSEMVGKVKLSIDVTDIMIRKELTKEEEHRLQDIADKNNILAVMGNKDMKWSSDGSLHVDDNIRYIIANELDFFSVNSDDGLGLIEGVNIQHGLLNIPSRMFWHSYKLEQLHLPDELQSIGERNFVNTQLREVDLSNCTNVKSIGAGSFSVNNILEKLILPTRCEKITYGSCDRNRNLRELIFPKDLRHVDYDSLSSNHKLEKIVLPEIEFNAVQYIMCDGVNSYENTLSNLSEIVTSRVNLENAKILAGGRDIIKIRS